MSIDLQTLNEAIGKDAAIRRVRRLQPIGGKGDKIFRRLTHRNAVAETILHAMCSNGGTWMTRTSGAC